MRGSPAARPVYTAAWVAWPGQVTRCPRWETRRAPGSGEPRTAAKFPPCAQCWPQSVGAAHCPPRWSLSPAPALYIAYRCRAGARPLVAQWAQESAPSLGARSLSPTPPLPRRVPTAAAQHLHLP